MKNFKLEDAIKVCNQIVEAPVENFTGIAVAVINEDFDKSHVASLRPELKLENINYFENTQAFIDYLNIGSKLGGVVHDGFHLMNNFGTITHSAQYFVPMPVKELPVNQLCGTRYHSALFGSVMKGIEFIITISSNKTIYIFQNGKIVYEKKSADYQEIV